MTSIGFSTGTLKNLDISLKEKVALVASSGSDAIELSFGTPPELNSFEIRTLESALRAFKHVSLHAPFKGMFYSRNPEYSALTSVVLNKLYALSRDFQFNGIVFHPNQILDISLLEKSHLPFLLENMDSRNKTGTDVAYFEQFNGKEEGFVLDIQHAYEHDSSMGLASKLAEIMGKRLNHMHVSGSTTICRHSSLFCSDNRDAISAFLKKDICTGIPIILEGLISSENPLESMKKELEYVKSLVH